MVFQSDTGAHNLFFRLIIILYQNDRFKKKILLETFLFKKIILLKINALFLYIYLVLKIKIVYSNSFEDY